MQACEVQLWSASTDDFGDAEWAGLSALLDRDELSRRQSLRHEADRRAFTLAHALRRLALAQALDVDASEIRFTADVNGKPGLAWPPEAEIFFSLSHARQAVVCAVTRSGEVGVDAEQVQGDPDFSLLEPFLATPSQAELAAAPAAQFFFYWTALEAFWKAHGLGLNAAHPRICVRPGRSGNGFDVAFEHDPQGVRRARLVGLPLRGGCAMTLAVRDTPGCARSAEPVESARNLSEISVRRLVRQRRNVI